MTTGDIIVDVCLSETLDRLVLKLRDTRQRYALAKSLNDLRPGLKVHHSASGDWVAADVADLLLELSSDIDLRWSPEGRVFAENRRRAKRVHGRVYQRVEEIRSGGVDVARRYLSDLDGLEVLDDHQVVNVAAMTLPDGYGLCVFDEQGAGKTVTFIYAFDTLVERDESDFALIVAPKSMVPEWPCDFRRFKDDLYNVSVVTGSRQQKLAAMRTGADVLVTNFETPVSIEPELTALLRGRQGRAILVVDESFYAKNLDAKRTRALRRLREWCGRAFVLCGTPAPNSPPDLVQQFNIVDFGMTFSGVDVTEDRTLARPLVQAAIEARGLFVRHLKADVLPDLPLKRFQRVLVPMQPEQKRLYESALNEWVLQLRGTDDESFRRELTSFFARRSALLQICSNPVSVSPGYSEDPAKVLALDGLLEEAIGKRKEKVVLWSFYTASIDVLVARYGRFNLVRYDGTVDDVALRREAIRRFQDDDATMLFVGNPAAAGAGITLHRARLAVYESMSNQAAHYLQSLDRIHRRGQTRDVEYIVLLCDKTIELEEYERLTSKERAAQDLLGDTVVEPVTRETMLAEAEAARSLFEF